MLVHFVSTDYSSLILYVRFEDGGEVTSLWALLGRWRLSPAAGTASSARAERSVPPAWRVWAQPGLLGAARWGPSAGLPTIHTRVCTPRTSPPSPARCMPGVSWGSESQGSIRKSHPDLHRGMQRNSPESHGAKAASGDGGAGRLQWGPHGPKHQGPGRRRRHRGKGGPSAGGGAVAPSVQ